MYPSKKSNKEKMEAPHEIAGVVVQDKGGRILVIQGTLEKWSFPKGKIEDGEDDFKAALREAYEEAGILLKDETCHGKLKLRYGTYYIYRISKNYSEIKLSTPETPDEVLQIGWFNRKSLLKKNINADLNFYLRSNYAFRHPSRANI